MKKEEAKNSDDGTASEKKIIKNEKTVDRYYTMDADDGAGEMPYCEEHFHQLFGNIIDFNVFIIGQFVSSLFKSLFTNYFLERLFKLIDRNVVRSLVLLEFYHDYEKTNRRKQRVLL